MPITNLPPRQEALTSPPVRNVHPVHFHVATASASLPITNQPPGLEALSTDSPTYSVPIALVHTPSLPSAAAVHPLPSEVSPTLLASSSPLFSPWEVAGEQCLHQGHPIGHPLDIAEPLVAASSQFISQDATQSVHKASYQVPNKSAPSSYPLSGSFGTHSAASVASKAAAKCELNIIPCQEVRVQTEFRPSVSLNPQVPSLPLESKSLSPINFAVSEMSDQPDLQAHSSEYLEVANRSDMEAPPSVVEGVERDCLQKAPSCGTAGVTETSCITPSASLPPVTHRQVTVAGPCIAVVASRSYVSSLKSKPQVHPDILLTKREYNRLSDTYGITCTLSGFDRYNVLDMPHASTMCTDAATFQQLNLSQEVVYMQPPTRLLDQYLVHYTTQKALYPAIGALLVAPASYNHPSLESFTHVEIIDRAYGHFQTLGGKRATPPERMYVYIDAPARTSGISVASTLGEDLLFNLPCTISGSKGTVSFTTSSLIDTGCSTRSLISKRAATRLSLAPQACSDTFLMADGTTASCLGQVSVRIKIQRHTFTVRAFVTDMNDSFDLILGQQWLHDHQAIIDFRRESITLKKGRTACTLIAPSEHAAPHATSRKKKARTKPVSVATVAKHLRKGGKVYEFVLTPSGDAKPQDADATSSAPNAHQDRISRLKAKFRDRFVDELPAGQKGPQAPVMITQEPGTQPVYTPPYRASPREIAEMRTQVSEGMAAGRIRVSNSPYGSSVLFVAKPDGSLRMCIDYRRLNKSTIKQRHPVPRIDDLLDQFGDAKVFSLIDLKAGYAQVRLHPDDIPKTAFNTPFGHFEYTVTPFGLANAPSMFSKLMQDILRPVLGTFATIYMDDCLCFSRTAEEHEEHLAQVLQLLRDHDLYANAKKCTLFTHRIKYLGHIIDQNGISVDPAKTAKLKDWPAPTTLKELQSFLGLCNYFRRFVPSYSDVARPLTRLTGKNAFHQPLTEPETKAFESLKAALVSPPVLAIPSFDKPFEVYTDASEYACGAVLVQDRRPVAYMSHLFDSAEQNYPTHDRECLGIVSAYREWRCYLEGVPSTCYTDHQ
jgi:predicted aspartyl protease